MGSAQRRLSGAFLQHGSILVAYDPALEAEVIPGGGSFDRATSLERELGRAVSIEEAIDAVRRGFEKTLDITLQPLKL